MHKFISSLDILLKALCKDLSFEVVVLGYTPGIRLAVVDKKTKRIIEFNEHLFE